ncbi:MAG: 30S ribosomal protein S16 [bacterium]|nr:30S ribosomal protein S16 [bacterium]
MLVIRLFRIGKINQPVFKIVVTEKTSPPKSGRFVEEVGFYNPVTKEKNFNKERIEYWIKNGAQPSDTLYNLFISEKIIQGKKRIIPIKKKQAEEAAPVAAASATATPVATPAVPAEIKPAPVVSETPTTPAEPVTPNEPTAPIEPSEPKKEEIVPAKEPEQPKETAVPTETPIVDTK